MSNLADWLYGIQSGLFIKIGVARDIRARLQTMNLYNPHPCKVIARRRTQFAYVVEKEVHRVLAPYAIGREWFACDPALVRATFTLVIKQVVSDRIAMQMELVRRSEARKSARGRDVDSTQRAATKIEKSDA